MDPSDATRTWQGRATSVHSARKLPAGRAECPREGAHGGKYLHGMADVVGAIHGVVGSDRDPVRPGELALAPRAEEPALPVEDDDRVLAAVEDVDPVP